jgi:hypothetical protein
MNLLPLLLLLKQSVAWVVEQATILKAEGNITEEEFQQIKTEAGISDTAWDEAVAAAKARLGG